MLVFVYGVIKRADRRKGVHKWVRERACFSAVDGFVVIPARKFSPLF